MDRVTRRWLAKAPVLLTAYLVWVNRGRRRGRRGLSAALALPIAWMAAVSIYVHADRAAAISTFVWLQRHDLFWATISTIVAGVLVSRRRALSKMAASRSWTAGLPVDRSTATWQALAIESVPALVMACVLAAMFGSLSIIALVDVGIPVPSGDTYSYRLTFSTRDLASAPNVCERQTENNSTCNGTGLAFRPSGIYGSRRHARDWFADRRRCTCSSGSSGYIGECQGNPLAQAPTAWVGSLGAKDIDPCSRVHVLRNCDRVMAILGARVTSRSMYCNRSPHASRQYDLRRYRKPFRHLREQ